MRLFLLLLTTFVLNAQSPRKVLVVSVDGLDQRYLANADALGLKIPNIRKLMAQGQWSEGVVGVVPTVTWPSHTTIISGVDPTVHGILDNHRPKSEGGDYYWSASLLKARTLIDAMKAAGKTTAAITWPVTVDAPLTYNLPEYFQKRQGGSMDTRSIESKAVPQDLVEHISAMYPSFPQEWMEDRTRTLATLYLVKRARPDLLLVHLVDLDSEAHENGPFSREANAAVEHIDELIGDMLRALPKDHAFVLVSDHGFEKVNDVINLSVAAKARKVEGLRVEGSLVIAETIAASKLLFSLKADGKHGIGREILKAELMKFAPHLAKAVHVFESSPGILFASTGTEHAKPKEMGSHGHWPMRYRSVYIAWGTGIRAGRLPEFSQKDIAGRLAALLGISFTPGVK